MHTTPRSPGARQEKKPTSRNKKLVNGAIIGVGALLVAGMGAAVVQDQRNVSQNAATAANYTPAVAPELPEADDRDTALFVGDSYTAGTGAESDADRWTSLVATEMDWREANIGQGGTGYVTTAGVSGCGQKFCAAYPEALRAFRTVPADIVVIAGGQNDFREYAANPDAVEEGVEKTFAQAQRLYPDAELIAVGPSTADDIGDVVTGLDASVQRAAKEVGAEYISLIDPEVIKDDMITEDGGHVNNDGHTAIAERVLSGLEKG